MSNQASEDELRAEILTEFKQVHKLAPADYTENCTNVVMSIIRTEKLKLLAEVRERVVGEDYDIPAEMEKVGRDFQQLDAIAKTGGLLNKFKADLRTKLTKLEAEL